MAVTNREIINRRAKFEYHFVQEFEAGIVLTGTEVKSIRAGNANLTDAYCVFLGDHLWVKNMYIAEYDQGTIYNHETRRDRILLLKKAELKKIKRKMDEKGMTLIPYKNDPEVIRIGRRRQALGAAHRLAIGPIGGRGEVLIGFDLGLLGERTDREQGKDQTQGYGFAHGSVWA
ncbi:MAG TPA: SsrA-binding protein [Flavobacteriales bacterium]|nr:SsrA-binding protein [Flavobacteriales bacterium]